MKKKLSILFVLCVATLAAHAQRPRQRVSPHDTVTTTLSNGVDVTLIYGRPSIKGRQLGVELAPAGQVWRTGADEATTIELSKDVKVNGKDLPAGKYSIHSIPDQYGSTIIFNKEWEKWGLKYDESQDALRVAATTQESGKFHEQFTIDVNKDGTVSLLWGDFKIPFKIE